MEGNSDLVICRCEEVTKQEILAAIKAGCRTAGEIKRMTRAGMGPCQGRTCGRLIERIISEQTGVPLSAVESCTVRFPVRPVRLSAIASSIILGDERTSASSDDD